MSSTGIEYIVPSILILCSVFVISIEQLWLPQKQLLRYCHFLSRHRSAETALYDCTYIFSELCSIFQYVIKRWLRALQLSGSRELLQAAHKIAVIFHKTFIVSCLGK